MGAVAHIDSTIGAEFIGVMVATLLWGVTCMQTWWYLDNYPNDTKLLKALVVATWISDTVHEVLICHIVYEAVVSNFGDVESVARIPPFLYLEVLFNGLTGLFVQSFFSYRIWMLRRNVWIVLLLALLVTAEFIVSLLYMAGGLSQHLYTAESIRRVKGLSMSINIIAAITDLLITGAMCMILNMSKTGSAWSDNIINRLMLFSIRTGLLTSICACMSLITILTFPTMYIYVAFYFVIGRLYANSLLATLNARKTMREMSMSNSRRTETFQLQIHTSRSGNGFRIPTDIDEVVVIGRDGDSGKSDRDDGG